MVRQRDRLGRREKRGAMAGLWLWMEGKEGKGREYVDIHIHNFAT